MSKNYFAGVNVYWYFWWKYEIRFSNCVTDAHDIKYNMTLIVHKENV